MKVKHQKRWNKALYFWKGVAATAELNSVTEITFDGDSFPITGLLISNNQLLLKRGNSSINLFEADPEYDHGLYTKSSEYIADMKSRIKLLKQVEL